MVMRRERHLETEKKNHENEKSFFPSFVRPGKVHDFVSVFPFARLRARV
jgi:hypothetical protein